MYLKTILLVTVAAFTVITFVVFVLHEQSALHSSNAQIPTDSHLRKTIPGIRSFLNVTAAGHTAPTLQELRQATKQMMAFSPNKPLVRTQVPVKSIDFDTPDRREAVVRAHAHAAHADERKSSKEAFSKETMPVEEESEIQDRPLWDDGQPDLTGEALEFSAEGYEEHEKVGTLMCNGKDTKSEVIYWKIVPGDDEFESPITPHHDNHHDRYLTFEYDNGGWNNMRMAIECLIVCAHAMGRTVVLPPFQNLYLISARHKDKHDKEAHSQMGFEDFFDLNILRSHKGFHVITMKEFLGKEALTGGLHGEFPPGNTSDAWGQPVRLSLILIYVFLRKIDR